MKKILIVFGTRPEAIKMAPIVLELKKQTTNFITKICVTAQHREMLDQVLDLFNISPDFDLNIMAPNQDLSDITAKVLIGLKEIFKQFHPDLILVHGDTTTAFATTLAGFYNKIKVGHVEAGLRTYNLEAPWPEEMNRQITDKLCSYYFAPTLTSKSNLLNEGIYEEKIVVTGNTVVDALLYALDLIENNTTKRDKIIEEISLIGFPIKENHINLKRKFILVTGHRRENFGEGFKNICQALKLIAHKFPEIDIVYPVHLNPNVQKPVFETLNNISNLYLIQPLNYLPFIYLMKCCYMIITDSGGIQEEAPTLGKPVLITRENTERPEVLNLGSIQLVGTITKKIVEKTEELICNKYYYDEISKYKNPFGDGNASKNIINYLLETIE